MIKWLWKTVSHYHQWGTKTGRALSTGEIALFNTTKKHDWPILKIKTAAIPSKCNVGPVQKQKGSSLGIFSPDPNSRKLAFYPKDLKLVTA